MKLRILKKVVRVGPESLGVIINKDICEELKIVHGDKLVIDIIRRCKK